MLKQKLKNKLRFSLLSIYQTVKYNNNNQQMFLN